MTTRLSLFAAVAALFWTVGCSGDSDRYEDVEKLRALGVATSPVVAKPSTAAAPSVVTLSVYAAVRKGDTVTAAPYSDQTGSSSGAQALVSIVANSAKTESHASFDIYHVDATLTVPEASALRFSSAAHNATVHYGVQLVSAAGGTQNVTGNVVIYPDGAPELTSLKALPTVKITSPSPSASLSGTQDLTATESTPNDETLRVGWFVNGGEIKNRNSAVTKWDPKKTTGPVTLVFTARGAKSGAFQLDVIDFTTN